MSVTEMILSNYTVLIPFLNEENRLPLILESLRPVRHVIGIDGGSTDRSTDIFKHYNRKVFLRQNVLSRFSEVSPQWYEEAYKYSETSYVLLNPCGYIYPIITLKRLDDLARRNQIRAVIFRRFDYYCGKLLPTSNALYHLISYNLAALSRKSLATSYFINIKYLNNSHYRIHHETSVTISNFRTQVATSSSLKVHYIRSDTSSQWESKHTRYADAEILLGWKKRFPITLLVISGYLKAFLDRYIASANILYGIPGFVYSHYWASYHASKYIRIWEKVNTINTSTDLLPSCLQDVRY